MGEQIHVYRCTGLGCGERVEHTDSGGCLYCGNAYERVEVKLADALDDATREIAASFGAGRDMHT